MANKKTPARKSPAEQFVKEMPGAEELVDKGVISLVDEEPTEACECKALAGRIENLERCLSKMSHFTGNNRVLAEFGIASWEVTKESMRKGGK